MVPDGAADEVLGLGPAWPVVSVCASAEALARRPIANRFMAMITAWRFDICLVFPTR
jgi:hypothetical protein